MDLLLENIADPFVIAILVMFLIVLVWLVSLPASIKHEREKKKAAEYHEQNYKQYNRGVDAKSLTSAKDALHQLESGYGEIKGIVSKASASCYEEDIRDVRSNIDSLVEERWSKKAEKILDDFLSAYSLITNPTFTNIEQAYRSKEKCLRQYDAYWEWTRKMHEENRDSLGNLNLWNEAKKMFRDAFGKYAADEDRGILNWNDGSTRQRIEKRLSDCIYAMQPEYKSKLELRAMILDNIFRVKSIQRSKLLGKSYPGFVEAEVAACYKGLLKEMCIIEAKQGSVYFVSLTEKGERARPKKNRKSDGAQPAVNSIGKQPENVIVQQEIATMKQLIEYLDKNQIKKVDKRGAGGCLWIISTPATDALLSKSKIEGKNFKKAKTRHFDGCDGWYIS